MRCLAQGIGNFLRCDYSSQGEAVSNTLSHGYYVRLDTMTLETPIVITRSAESCLDLKQWIHFGEPNHAKNLINTIILGRKGRVWFEIIILVDIVTLIGLYVALC